MLKVKPSYFYLFVIIVLSILAFKIYLEIDLYIYKNGPEYMPENKIVNIQIDSPVEHKVLNTEDCKIHYYKSGTGREAIVLLHPAFSDHRAFDQQIDFFAKEYTLICIDILGHGLSKAESSKDKIDATSRHINEILEIENFEKVHLIGVSMGSLIAQHFAFEYPNKTKSIIALGGYSIHKDSKEIEKAQRSTQFGLVLRALFSMNSFRKAVAKMTCYTKKGQSLFYQSTSYYKRKSFLVMQGLNNIISDRIVSTPQYKTLILVGEHDIELAIRKAEEWHNDNANSEFKIIENAGHCAHMDQAIIFNQIVIDFIKDKVDKSVSSTE